MRTVGVVSRGVRCPVVKQGDDMVQIATEAKVNKGREEPVNFQEKGISQKKLEELSGVKQPVIARMESGATSPQIDTLLKVLIPLGKTLAVVPLKPEKKRMAL